MQLEKALKDITVVDFTQAFAGPYCTMMLADNGARVIKIERPGCGDMLRDAGPFSDSDESLYFVSGNRGKESITLDLTKEADCNLAKKIIKNADILVENFKPGVMAKLGFSYETVSALQPSIIYASISGFGHTGPKSYLPGFDMVAQGYSGIMSVNGESDQTSERMGVSIGDMAGGMFAYMALTTALYAREKTGKGTYIDISMLDSLFALLPPQVAHYNNTGIIDTPVGNHHPNVCPFGVIKSKDGEIIVSVLGKKLWHLFCDAIGKPEIEADARFSSNEARLENRVDLQSIVHPVIRGKTTCEWLEILNQIGIPCAPVNNLQQASEMEQITARDMLIKAGNYIVAGNPMKLSAYDCLPTGAVPKLGEHTESIIKEFS